MQGKIPEDDIPLHATMTITQAMLLDSDIPRVRSDLSILVFIFLIFIYLFFF